MDITHIKLIILSLAVLVVSLGLLLLLCRNLNSSLLSLLEESKGRGLSSTLISFHSIMLVHEPVVSIAAHTNGLTELCQFHLSRLNQAVDLVAHDLTAIGNKSIIVERIS